MANAVTYAEDRLGVHDILKGTIEARGHLDKALTVLSEARDARRRAEQDKEDIEIELAIAERGKHADMSQAQMDKHLKQVWFQNEMWRNLRDQIRELSDKIDGADLDRKILERDIEMGCARMVELGGYLQYLAAAKLTSAAVKPSEA